MVEITTFNASYGLGEAKSQEAESVAMNTRDFVNEVKRLVYEGRGTEFL